VSASGVCESGSESAALIGDRRYFLGMKARPKMREKKIQSVSYQSQTSAWAKPY
jgi:hypothetical protein